MEPVVQSDTNDDGVLAYAQLASASMQAALTLDPGPPSRGAYAGPPSCMLPRCEIVAASAALGDRMTRPSRVV